MTFVFVFRPKMNVHFPFHFVFGSKWNFVFVSIFVYGRKWKMLFGQPLVYITKRSWSWDAKSWSWTLGLVLNTSLANKQSKCNENVTIPDHNTFLQQASCLASRQSNICERVRWQRYVLIYTIASHPGTKDYLPRKSHQNLSTTFWVIPLTHGQTHKHDQLRNLLRALSSE